MLDINEVSTDVFEVNISPNPVKDILSISFKLASLSDIRIIVFDELGRVVKKEKVVKGYAGNNKLSLDVSNLHSGIYFVSLNINNEIVTNQIFKQ